MNRHMADNIFDAECLFHSWTDRALSLKWDFELNKREDSVFF